MRKQNIILTALIVTFLFGISWASADYKLNPFTKKLDYYVPDTAGSGVTTTITVNSTQINGPDFTFATSSDIGLNFLINNSGTTLTFQPALQSGYIIPLSASTTNWQTAYLWGNHASANYLDLDTYPNADTDSTDDYTSSDFSTDLAGTTTDALSEGVTNLYNQTHTGEVTGSIALTVTDNIIDEANLKINTPTDNYLFTASSTASGGFAWTATSSPVLGLVQFSDLHNAVTLSGESYLSLSGQVITANAISPANLAASDFGDWTCNGTTCSLDTGVVSDNEIDFSNVTLNDFTNDVGYVLQSYASTTYVIASDWTTIDNYPSSCTNQFVRGLGDTLTCATVADADVDDNITVSNYLSLTDWYATTTDQLTEGSTNLYNQTHSGDVAGATTLTIQPNAVDLGTDTVGNYVSSATANGGLVLTGTEGASLGMITSCSDGQLLEYTAAGGWACANDDTGGAGVWTDYGSYLYPTNDENIEFSYFTASSTNATSTIVDNFEVQGSSTFGTIISGLWNGTAIGDTYLTKTGDWTGTFDSYEGTYYLDYTNLTNKPTNFSDDDLSDNQLGQIGDVSTSTLATNDVLYYTGSGWSTTATSTWDTDTTCDGQSCNVTNTGTLDGYEAAALLDNTDAQTLSYDAPTDVITISGGNTIDITEVDTVNTYTASNGLTVSSFDIQPATDYSIPLTASTTEWATAYGWGDHSAAGYLTSYTETDPIVKAISGIVKSNGSTISAAVSGTDYEVPITFSTGLTRSVDTVTVNTSQNIDTLSNLTTNGFVKTSGGTGALSVDTSTYLTGNETITLSGDVSGSGATAITTTIGSDKITEAMLKSVDTAADEECLTYEATVGDFEWQTCSSGGTPGGSDGQVQYNNGGAFGGASSLYYDDVNNYVGIGTTTPAKLLDIIGDVSGGIVQFTRTPSSAIDATYGTFNIKAIHDGDMADGFGTGLQFMIQDNANVENTIASIQVDRDGADNSGSLDLVTYSAGSSISVLKLNAGGGATAAGDWDFGGGGIEIENNTALPGSCTVGQLFMDTDATSGQQLYGCEGGSFVLQGDGGGGGSSLFTDAGDFAYLTATADDLVLGSAVTSTSAFWFDVSANQLVVNESGTADWIIKIDTDDSLVINDGTDDLLTASSTLNLIDFPQYYTGVRPFIHLTKTTIQNTGGANGTETYMTWQVQDHIDTDWFTHDTATNAERIYVDKAGRYSIKATVGITQGGSARTTSALRFRVNGTTKVLRGGLRNYSRGSAYGDISTHLDTEIDLNAGDYVEVYTWIDDTDATYTMNTINDESEVIMRKID